MQPVTQAHYQAASDTLSYLKKKTKWGEGANQPTLFLKIDARHTSASRALAFSIPAFLHRLSSDDHILQINDFRTGLASSSLHYIFILLKCPLEPRGEGFC